MNDISVSRNRPDNWDTLCRDNGALFHSHEWQNLLERSFRCRTDYGGNESAGYAMAISTFPAGPFRIGYLGFPVGGLIGNRPLDPGVIDEWRQSRSLFNCHCLRVPVSAFEESVSLPLPYTANPETAICDLQDWDIQQVSKKLRRDLKKAQRAGLTLTDASNLVKGSDLYSIYSNTVRRHGGSLRYNEQYFSSLLSLSGTHPGLRCIIALCDKQLAGFVVVALHKHTAYYLHGGTEFSLRHHSPSDLLLHEAINWARERGSKRFNLMTSSVKQASLVRYKEKWGAVTREHRTYTLGLNPSACFLFGIAETIANKLRR